MYLMNMIQEKANGGRQRRSKPDLNNFRLDSGSFSHQTTKEHQIKLVNKFQLEEKQQWLFGKLLVPNF
jgi:capsule polysaccharide export protein KpsE/RkpR